MLKLHTTIDAFIYPKWYSFGRLINSQEKAFTGLTPIVFQKLLVLFFTSFILLGSNESTAQTVCPELIVNGAFSKGNSGFSSDYTYCNTQNCVGTEGYYGVGNNPNFFYGGFQGADHSGGPGNMMVINGNTIVNKKVWCQTITAEQNKDYTFSYWVSTIWKDPSFPTSPAQLQVFVNNVATGSVFTAPDALNTWQLFSINFNSGSATNLTICIVNNNTTAIGNDFGLDDLSLKLVDCSTCGTNTEVCDGIDNNCNGLIDERVGDPLLVYYDGDGDGYGVTDLVAPWYKVCPPPANFVTKWGDCNDRDATIHPGAPEACDGKDNNCNGLIDEGIISRYFRDADGDGYGDPDNFTDACSKPYGYVSNNYDSNDADGKARIYICHKGSNIVVNDNAAQAHLKHGDYLGQCSSAPVLRLSNQPIRAQATPVNFALTLSPNPVSKTAHIAYSVASDAKVSIVLYDELGKEVAIIFKGNREAGYFYIDYNTSKLGKGIYYCRMISTAHEQQDIQIQKLIKVN
jgi:hypothetical protein